MANESYLQHNYDVGEYDLGILPYERECPPKKKTNLASLPLESIAGPPRRSSFPFGLRPLIFRGAKKLAGLVVLRESETNEPTILNKPILGCPRNLVKGE